MLLDCIPLGELQAQQCLYWQRKKQTLVYGSGDYTRINPAMDEHGEINILIFNGLTAHDGDNQVVQDWQRAGILMMKPIPPFHMAEGCQVAGWANL